MKRNLLFIVFMIPIFFALAQGNNSLRLSSSVSCVCQNFKGDIYLGLMSGDIVKLDEKGAVAQQFSYPNLSQTTSITCANPLKVMAFYRDNQNYLLLERFSSQSRMYDFPTDRRIEFATLAPDQSIWVVTTNELQLIRIDTQGAETILYQLSSVLPAGDALIELKNYENGMALLTEQKLFRFNLMGQLIQTHPLESKNISYVLGREIYSKKKDAFLVSTPGDPKSRTISIIDDDYDYLIETKAGMILIKNDLISYLLR